MPDARQGVYGGVYEIDELPLVIYFPEGVYIPYTPWANLTALRSIAHGPGVCPTFISGVPYRNAGPCREFKSGHTSYTPSVKGDMKEM